MMATTSTEVVAQLQSELADLTKLDAEIESTGKKIIELRSTPPTFTNKAERDLNNAEADKLTTYYCSLKDDSRKSRLWPLWDALTATLESEGCSKEVLSDLCGRELLEFALQFNQKK